MEATLAEKLTTLRIKYEADFTRLGDKYNAAETAEEAEECVVEMKEISRVYNAAVRPLLVK